MNRVILGIDEVGRGPYAGPLVIGACILPHDRENHPWIDELNDSKKLSKKKREELYKKIKKYATSATGWVPAKELDRLGVSNSLKYATRLAVEEIRTKKVPFSEIVIDGISNFLQGTTLEKYVTTMKKADFYVKEVSAASIIAKVERDNYMVELSKKYPGYGFENHVGYGTREHQLAMERLGLTPEHRRSFTPVAKIEALAEKKKIPPKNTTVLGKRAEKIVADFLSNHGHEILKLNFKTKVYEIDIISKKNEVIYFTEVKYRKDTKNGEPKEMVTPKKLEQMTFSAEMFMRKYDNDFKLAVGTVIGKDFDFDDWFVLD